MGTVVHTFTYTGANQTDTVPAGTISAVIECYGAAGGPGGASSFGGIAGGVGGLGGYAAGTLASLVAGDTLTIEVGGVGGTGSSGASGTAPGGWPAGGNGGNNTANLGGNGGGGGGRSRVTKAGTDLMAAAGGAGGGGGFNSGFSAVGGAGGAGGAATGATGGSAATSQPGTGGTQAAGGTGGTGGGGVGTGANGALHGGGAANASNGTPGGGGGGDGYYGGGGASSAAASNGAGAGGGGGSNLVTGTATTSTQGVRAGNGTVVITYTTYTAPNAPTLTAPANASYIDVTAGGNVTYIGTASSTDGQSINARALRLKLSGGSYSYWNASTVAWQGTIVWNTVSIGPTASGSFGPITSGVANGSTYNWSLADQEAGGNNQGPFASDFTFNAQLAPAVTVTAPTGSVVAGTQPNVTWTTTPATGLAQTFYRVVVEHGAYSTTPGSGTQDWDSTTLAGAAQQLQIGVALSNTVTYRAFVMVTETNGVTSVWGYTTFTLTLDPSAQPTIAAVAGTDGTTGCPRIAITVQGRDNGLTTNQASLETDTTGWAAGTSTSIARSTAKALDGVASLLLTRNTTTGVASANTPTGTSGTAVLPSTQYTALASFLTAATARSCSLTINWYQASGAPSAVRASDTSGAVTDNTSTWTQASLTVTSPSDAVFASIVVNVAAAVATEQHYVDCIDIAPGASTVWTRGGLIGSTAAIVTRSDGIIVRGTATGAALAFSGQTVTVYDYEITPGVSYTYTAVIIAVVGGSTITSSASAASGSVSVATTDWWIFDPTNVAGAINPAVTAYNAPRFEQTSARPVLGQSTANVVSGVVMTSDGNVTFETFTSAMYTSLTALLTSQVTLVIHSPYGDFAYGRFGLQPSVGGSSGSKVGDKTLQPSTGSAPHRVIPMTFVAQQRP